MILIASPSKPLTYTAKGTTRRKAVLAEYSVEIDALYASFEESSQFANPPPSTWSDGDALAFVRKVVRQTMSDNVQDEDDLFDKGCSRYASRVF